MCENFYAGQSPVGKTPADELSSLLQRELRTTPIECASLRALIRNHWSKLAALAHKIHDEEEKKSGLRKAARNVAALSEEGIMNMVEGKTVIDCRESFLAIADAIKNR